MAYIIFFLFFISTTATASSPPLPLPPLQPLPLQSPPPPPQSQQLVPPPSQQQPLSPPPIQSPPPPTQPPIQSPPPPTQPPPPSQPSPERPPSSSPPPKLQQQRPAEIPQERMNNILEALIGSGDFANWANLLNMADPSLLPFTSTLFVPNNDVVSSFLDDTGSGSDSDPFLFLYHVVPNRLSFSDLCLFRHNTRLPTLLPTKSILITNTSKFNFTIDGARITDPDLYSSDSVTVHGIGGLLDYHIYGGVSSFPSARQNQSSPPPVKAAAAGGGPTTIVVSSKGETLRGGFAVACCAALMTNLISLALIA
ncbi:hypothetical protein QQ045_016433 [Rhodiola kirilowii]